MDLRFDTSDIELAMRVAASSPDDDGFATGSVVAIVTEDAEPIYIHERRDTLEQPPLRRPRETVPPTPITDDPTAPMDAPRDIVAAMRGIPPLRLDRR